MAKATTLAVEGMQRISNPPGDLADGFWRSK
jgi:hypothetical protein